MNKTINTLITMIKEMEITQNQMSELSQCCQKLVNTKLAEGYSIETLIEQGTDDTEVVYPLVKTKVMSAPKLAHILVGAQRILEERDVSWTLDKLITESTNCSKLRDSSGVLSRMNHTPEKKKKPSGMFPME